MKNYTKVIFLSFILIFSYSLESSSKQKRSNILKMSKLLKGLELYSPRLILRNREKLNLSVKQKELIETEILSHEKQIIKTGAEIKINELELVFLLSEEPVNREKLSEKIRLSGKLKTNSFLKHIKHLFNIKDILTKKQVEILCRKMKN